MLGWLSECLSQSFWPCNYSLPVTALLSLEKCVFDVFSSFFVGSQLKMRPEIQSIITGTKFHSTYIFQYYIFFPTEFLCISYCHIFISTKYLYYQCSRISLFILLQLTVKLAIFVYFFLANFQSSLASFNNSLVS